MKYTIPLTSGDAFQTFSVTLGETQLKIALRWSTRYEFYSVDIHQGSKAIIKGRGLHPNIDLLQDLHTGLGKLYLEGLPATPDNLGLENKLRYETV